METLPIIRAGFNKKVFLRPLWMFSLARRLLGYEMKRASWFQKQPLACSWRAGELDG